MFEPVLIVLVPLGLMIAGIAILWAQGQAPSYARSPTPTRLDAALSVLGWTLLLVGLFTAVGLTANVFFILAWIVLAVVLVSLLYRYRSMERRSLLWTLMLAAEREIPLETAARAFAEERRDHLGARSLELAEYLEAGLPLALALKRSRLAYPQAVLLAAELGEQTGSLGTALRQALGRTEDSETLHRSNAERMFYLGFLVLYATMIWTFLVIKLVPTFLKILTDFDVAMPPATEVLVGVSWFMAHYWPLVLLVAVVLVIALLRSLSYYTGSSPRYLPGVGPGWQRADRSVIMRWLAHAVRQSRPLPEMMRLICGYLMARGLRRRLERAAKQIDQGADWTDCLRKVGLIRPAEAAVFRCAERAGNLAWALEEMADSSVRRSAYRVRAVMNVVFPAAIVALGCSVLFVMFALLAPLISMIVDLIE